MKICKYKNKRFKVTERTLELFKKDYPEEYEKIVFFDNPHDFLNYEKLVELMNNE